ncbi:ead/Ea22-like family protein [Salmonella enterica subsp. arizonae serovar 35:z4,z32:-]|nr:ead/Ea22-like family protein [Salmonella enterica subsp. arizonae serovar 35:z4,z32:-]
MSNIDKQALREEFRYMRDHYNDPADRKKQEIYIAAEALLDELDKKQQYIKLRDQENEDIALTVGKLRVELEAAKKRIAEPEKGHQEAAKQINSWRRLAKQNIAERGKDISELEAARQRIAELERANAAQDDHINQQQVRIDALEETNHELGKAARVNSYWKPDVCPVTGRQFFMWIEHETLGYVPTYGGPFDSYTIPTRDSSGEFSCERYDHDFGGWVGGEFIGLYLIDDDEQCRVCELEERIAELEARTVVVKQFDDFQIVHYGATEDYAKGYIDCQSNYNKAIRAAGIKVKGE